MKNILGVLFAIILALVGFLNLSQLFESQGVQNYMRGHWLHLIAVSVLAGPVLLLAVSKSFENLIGLTGKSVPFETILKASMVWQAGHLILPRGISNLILLFLSFQVFKLTIWEILLLIWFLAIILPFLVSSVVFFLVKGYSYYQTSQLKTQYVPPNQTFILLEGLAEIVFFAFFFLALTTSVLVIFCFLLRFKFDISNIKFQLVSLLKRTRFLLGFVFYSIISSACFETATYFSLQSIQQNYQAVRVPFRPLSGFILNNFPIKEVMLCEKALEDFNLSSKLHFAQCYLKSLAKTNFEFNLEKKDQRKIREADGLLTVQNWEFGLTSFVKQKISANHVTLADLELLTAKLFSIFNVILALVNLLGLVLFSLVQTKVLISFFHFQSLFYLLGFSVLLITDWSSRSSTYLSLDKTVELNIPSAICSNCNGILEIQRGEFSSLILLEPSGIKTELVSLFGLGCPTWNGEDLTFTAFLPFTNMSSGIFAQSSLNNLERPHQDIYGRCFLTEKDKLFFERDGEIFVKTGDLVTRIYPLESSKKAKINPPLSSDGKFLVVNAEVSDTSEIIVLDLESNAAAFKLKGKEGYINRNGILAYTDCYSDQNSTCVVRLLNTKTNEVITVSEIKNHKKLSNPFVFDQWLLAVARDWWMRQDYEKGNYLLAKHLKSNAEEEIGFTNFEVKLLAIFSKELPAVSSN